MEAKERLDLADNFTAGAAGVEHLIKEAKESAPKGIDPLPAIRAFISLSQQSRWQQRTQEQLQVAEALLAQVLDPATEGSQAGPQERKERCMHDKYIYLSKA